MKCGHAHVGGAAPVLLRGRSHIGAALRCHAAAVQVPKQQYDQAVRSGDSESEWMDWQANKPEAEQATIASYLGTNAPTGTVDVAVVGCGPAGLTLSAALAARGVAVCLIGPESKFTNNYGVWVDEFRALGLGHLLEQAWDESLCYFFETEKRLQRAYGQVDRQRMRDHLLSQCAKAGVYYVPSAVVGIDTPDGAAPSSDSSARSGAASAQAPYPSAAATSNGGGSSSGGGGAAARGSGASGAVPSGISSGDSVHEPAVARTADGTAVAARIVTLAGGAPSGKFLSFEDGAPPVAAQTAYGITARCTGYENAFDADAMLFMDWRRTHSGMWDGTGTVLNRNPKEGEVTHPNWNANFGSCGEAPSFLYAMPLADGTVFLEETCLVARPTLPFSVLKRRLHRRCAAMGITIEEVTDEEASFIPVGGPLPRAQQPITAFGAAANLVHPATGYSITRMLEESGPLADAMAGILRRDLSVADSAAAVWQALWPLEKRRQASFHIFGMELLAGLEVQEMHEFFDTFFRLPDRYWRGFLASKLSSRDLMVFAMLTFLRCSAGVRARLIKHLATPAGAYMFGIYTQRLREDVAARWRQWRERS